LGCGLPVHGFAGPEIPGISREQVDAAVDELRRGGYVEALWTDPSFGDNPAHHAPSVLTFTGQHLLEELQRTK
jgi:hypothetical protein